MRGEIKEQIVDSMLVSQRFKAGEDDFEFVNKWAVGNGSKERGAGLRGRGEGAGVTREGIPEAEFRHGS